MGAVCCAGHAMLGVEVGFRMEMALGLGSGTTFITAHLFFYSTYNICQKQDTHTHMGPWTHTHPHTRTHGHILVIYFVFERAASDTERVRSVGGLARWTVS